MRSHLQEVMNGLPVPPAATYPSAGESYGGEGGGGTTLALMVVKEGAPSVADIWVVS